VLRRGRHADLRPHPLRRYDASVFLYAFDLIDLSGDDLRREPLEVRKATPKSVLAKAGPSLRLNEHIEADGPTVFAHACKMGLEGIVSKHKASAYRSGRSSDWLKCKNPACEAVKREAEEDWAKEMALTGNDDAFKYDIAFSFVKEDEGLATQLNDLVQDRYRTFLYSKAQDQLVGTDGEKTFNAVFGEQARTIAVLLRPEWGHTPWTRIEETSIRNRAYSQGYDFATFIVTVPGTPIPDWLPRTRIWYDLQRFDLSGAAAVLESRVQERGGTAGQETLADRAARVQRAQELNRQRDAFKHSYEGAKAGQEAYGRVVGDLKANAELLSSLDCRIHDVPYEGVTMVVGQGVVLTVKYEFAYANTLEKTALVAQFYDGIPRLRGLMPLRDEASTLKMWRFTFGLLGPGRRGWVGPDGKEHAPEALAEFLLSHFMELQQRRLGQGARPTF
jgi:hypothetical protein